MKVNQLWEQVKEGKAIAISPNGCSVSGEKANDYSPKSEWKIVKDNEEHYINNGRVLKK
jgi:hypothetical protein